MPLSARLVFALPSSALPSQRRASRPACPLLSPIASSGKGFGSQSTKKGKGRKKKGAPPPPKDEPILTGDPSNGSTKATTTPLRESSSSSPSSSPSPPPPPPPPSSPPPLLRREIPTEVTDAMLGRIITFSGIPLIFAFAAPGLFYYLAKIRQPHILFPPWVVYVTSFITFGSAILGISYGIISTRVQPRQSYGDDNEDDEEGFLQWATFQRNLKELQEAIKRGDLRG